ncbi:MAG: hypothetical protein Q9164_006925 [Protoblastenia rupestris]
MPASTSMNGMGGGGSMVDGSGTINPAALNTPATTSSPLPTQSKPRGQKRSRSPDHGDGLRFGGEDDSQKAKKRGRTSQIGLSNEASSSSVTSGHKTSEPIRTPQPPPALQSQDTNTSPTTHTSPPKATPTKAPVIKALPTVRDHTTDQLTPEGDEFIPREHDPDGERKVSLTGHLSDGREYKMRTFYVPNRGEKLFMLATECARVLGYRDSYLLFNKNRSLYKIIATQAEKDELIHQEILPYSYRSRQIAIVTAKSMFRQFGARVISEGRRVRDDYWEGKARKQGFTEEDLAGDKRPGATKARDAAAVEAANNDPSSGLTHQDIDYRDVPLPIELSGSLPPPLSTNTPIPMIRTDARDYGSIPRLRQDVSGIPYQDRTQSSPTADVMHQATNAAELNKAITQQRNYRSQNYKDTWNRKIEPPVPSSQGKVEQSPTMTHSPQMPSNAMINSSQQQSVMHHQQAGSQMVSPQRYQQQLHHHTAQQSPVRQAMPPSIRPELQHPQRTSIYNPNQHAQTSPYTSYPHSQPQLWGQPPPHPQAQQPQQSPVSTHHPALQHYSPSHHPQQLQQHPSQSPHHSSSHQPPQLHHSGSHGNMYASMSGGSLPGSGYAGMGTPQQRNMYNQPGTHSGSPTAQQQHFMQQTTAAQQAGMQGWAPPPLGGGQQSGAQGWSGYPASSGGF